MAVERVRKFRNRIAQHDSTINVDISFEIRQIIELASYIDGNAVVVPAKHAWSFYETCRAYVCQSGQAFRPIARMAFYVDREIKAEIPAVLHRRDNVEWTPEEANRLRASPDRFDRKIANVIDSSVATLADGRYQIFLLTGT